MQYVTFKTAEFMKNGETITMLKAVTRKRSGLHAHDFIEFAYVVSGTGYHMVGGEKDNIKKGDFFILNAHVPHEYTVKGSMPVVMLNCIFHPSAIDSTFADCKDFVDVAYHYLFHSFYSEDDPKNYIKLTGGRSRKIGALLEDMLEEYEAKGNGYKQVLRSDLTKLLILAFRLYKESARQTTNAPVLRKLVVDSSVRYMQSEYAAPITCELLAERSYVSTSYFNKIFKEETGKSASKMLMEIRLEKACGLLVGTDLPASQIGLNVGYSDTKHFYDLFKRQTGMTPGEYRRKHVSEENQK